MELTTTTIIFSICGTLIGFVIAKIFEKSNATKIIKDANKEASIILKSANQDGESLKKDKMLQAKERFIELKSEHEKVIYSREDKIKSLERAIHEKDSTASKLLKTQSDLNLDLESKSKDFDKKIASLDKKRSELDKNRINQIKQLEVISGLSEEDAKEQLLGSLKEEAKTDAMKFIQDRMEEAKMTVEQDAKKIIINTIQRIGTEESIDNCVSVSKLL
jgi:ribonuclease Y